MRAKPTRKKTKLPTTKELAGTRAPALPGAAGKAGAAAPSRVMAVGRPARAGWPLSWAPAMAPTVALVRKAAELRLWLMNNSQVRRRTTEVVIWLGLGVKSFPAARRSAAG